MDSSSQVQPENWALPELARQFPKNTLAKQDAHFTVQTVKTIEIDDRLHEFLLSHVREFNESASQVIGRLCGFAEGSNPRPAPTNLPIEDYVSSNDFRFARGAVGRFLKILSWLHRRNPDGFKVVNDVRGRGRLYFAETAKALESAGKSVNPKQIPNSQYWVISTTPTDLKQEIIEKVMELLGYERRSVEIARIAVAGKA